MTAVRVLVVDDDALQLELVERALARDGFEICGVDNVAAMVARGPVFAPEIVLVDVNLPDETPARVVALAREVARGARVVLYSAWDEARLRTLAAELGADAYISKGGSAVAIAQRLRQLTRGGP